MWFNKDAETFLPASVTLGSPSDNTTPRCQRVARGWFFCLYQTLKLLHWVLSGGAGWPGRGSDFKANSIFQPPQDFQEVLKRGHLHRYLFVGTWLHQTDRLIRADRPGQPEPPGSTRCSMSSTSKNSTAFNVFIIGVNNLLRLHT